MTGVGAGPSDGELALIEAEGPVLAAELALVNAEVAAACEPGELARARVRAAEAVLAAVLVEQLNEWKQGA